MLVCFNMIDISEYRDGSIVVLHQVNSIAEIF